jgi:hypothetical protein
MGKREVFKKFKSLTQSSLYFRVARVNVRVNVRLRIVIKFRGRF